MDTKNYVKRLESSELADLPRRRTVVGAKQLRKALNNGSAQKVFLARDADPAITEPLVALCLQKHVKCIWVSNMTDLGKACGIDVRAAAAAAVDPVGSNGLHP